MKRKAVYLVVLLSTLMAGVGLHRLWSSPGSSQTISPLSVPICELQRHPELYVGKRIAVSGLLHRDWQPYMEDLHCGSILSQRLTVTGNLPEWTFLPFCAATLTKESVIAKPVTVVGNFRSNSLSGDTVEFSDVPLSRYHLVPESVVQTGPPVTNIQELRALSPQP